MAVPMIFDPKKHGRACMFRRDVFQAMGHHPRQACRSVVEAVSKDLAKDNITGVSVGWFWGCMRKTFGPAWITKCDVVMACSSSGIGVSKDTGKCMIVWSANNFSQSVLLNVLSLGYLEKVYVYGVVYIGGKVLFDDRFIDINDVVDKKTLYLDELSSWSWLASRVRMWCGIGWSDFED